MNLIQILKQSHQTLYDLGDQLLHSQTPQQQEENFNQLWQHFFAHEKAEEYVAIQILHEQDTDKNMSEQNLHYTVHEHHYFERFIEDIAVLEVNDERREKLIQDLVKQINEHMQYEEQYIFPQFDKILTEEVQQRFIDEYSARFKEIKPSIDKA